MCTVVIQSPTLPQQAVLLSCTRVKPANEDPSLSKLKGEIIEQSGDNHNSDQTSNS